MRFKIWNSKVGLPDAAEFACPVLALLASEGYKSVAQRERRSSFDGADNASSQGHMRSLRLHQENRSESGRRQKY
jgi:hypothetical protein